MIPCTAHIDTPYMCMSCELHIVIVHRFDSTHNISLILAPSSDLRRRKGTGERYAL